MKTLVIHPDDRSTDFLCPIYEPVKNKTVITGNITKDQLRKHILDHDRVICCGHGSPTGLFSVGRFLGAYPYIVDDSMAENLRHKICIYIWCNADQFVQRHCLYGFYTGMFISEVSEALYYNFWNLDDLEHLIEESNHEFSSIVAKHLDQGLFNMYQYVVADYSRIGKTNPIAQFNLERLFLNLPTQPLVSGKDFNVTQYNLHYGCN